MSAIGCSWTPVHIGNPSKPLFPLWSKTGPDGPETGLPKHPGKQTVAPDRRGRCAGAWRGFRGGGLGGVFERHLFMTALLALECGGKRVTGAARLRRLVELTSDVQHPRLFL